MTVACSAFGTSIWTPLRRLRPGPTLAAYWPRERPCSPRVIRADSSVLQATKLNSSLLRPFFLLFLRGFPRNSLGNFLTLAAPIGSLWGADAQPALTASTRPVRPAPPPLSRRQSPADAIAASTDISLGPTAAQLPPSQPSPILDGYRRRHRRPCHHHAPQASVYTKRPPPPPRPPPDQTRPSCHRYDGTCK